jgi:hypothetical protein
MINNKSWARAEKTVAKELQGRRTPGSGNGNRKGDIQANHVLLEMKETSRQKLTFRLHWLLKITEEAKVARKIPALGMEFQDGSRRFLLPDRYSSMEHKGYKDWKERVTVSLTPEDLEEGDIIFTPYGPWCVVSINLLKEVADGGSQYV